MNSHKLKQYHFTQTDFSQLMLNRIRRVLLICSAYDAFMLEEDGRIEEQIFNEYVALNLRYPPEFIQVSSAEKAFEELENSHIDLVISMLNVEGMDTFQLAKKIKSLHPNKPIVVLTPFSREVSLKLSREDTSAIDFVFCWLGQADILMAIIKLIEDSMNVEHDSDMGVQAILLIEDSIRFYSSYLPSIYKIIFTQSKRFMTEGLNDHQQMLRMRGRPKILLATNYDAAEALYNKYKNNILGIISDVSYNRKGIRDEMAGIRFCRKVKEENKYTPILLQSSDMGWVDQARELQVGFLHKKSKALSMELTDFITQFFAFGNFVFIDPQTHHPIMEVSDLKSLQQNIHKVPAASLEYHLNRDHFSKWLNARALFPIAELFKYLKYDDFRDLNHVRTFLFDAIAGFRVNKGRGVIAEFYREKFDEYLTFTRVGEGSIGGKARGLAFLDALIKRSRELDEYADVVISIPKTVVLTTDIFDEFMTQNRLHAIALSEADDQEILDAFVAASLPARVLNDLSKLITIVGQPIAVRSSSLLEDAHYQPFAGIYSTYMIPKIKDDVRMLRMLTTAIKSVYASVYFASSKAYMNATANVIDEEKMAIVLQEVCGQSYGDRFYPTVSGVARSVNFYPIAPEKPDDGIANISFGLGKNTVEGGVTLRFSPVYPDKVLQLSTPEMALQETQKKFYALSLDPERFQPSVNDAVNLLQLSLREAEKDGSLGPVASVYDFQNNILREGKHHKGKPVLTFSNLLKYNQFPLADILCRVLRVGQKEMNQPIEIEFAVNLNQPEESPKVFYLLQIRPIVNNTETLSLDLSGVRPEQTVILSREALGNGEIKGLQDIVYVKTQNFKPENNPEIAMIVNRINNDFVKLRRNYVLIGPGRWGSSDHWLGIPVRWSQISEARVIIEAGLANYRIDPSQGTHFFQNLTSFRVGYFTVNPYTLGGGHYDQAYLDSLDAVYEDHLVRHVRVPEGEFVARIDGQRRIGVIYKASETQSVPTAY